MQSTQDAYSLSSDSYLVALLASISKTPFFLKKKKNQEEKYYSFSYFVATLIFKGVFKALSHGVFLKEHKFYYSCFLFINKTHI